MKINGRFEIDFTITPIFWYLHDYKYNKNYCNIKIVLKV